MDNVRRRVAASLMAVALLWPAAAAAEPTTRPQRGSSTTSAPSSTSTTSTTAARKGATGGTSTSTTLPAAPRTDEAEPPTEEAPPAVPVPAPAVPEDPAPAPPPPPAPEDVPPAPAPPAPPPPVDPAQVVQVVDARLEAARQRLTEAEAARAAAAALVAQLEADLVALDGRVAALQEEERAALERLDAARGRVASRAADAYVRGSLARMETVIEARDPGDLARRIRVVRSVLEADHAAVEEFRAARADAGRALRRLLTERDGLEDQLEVARADLVAHEAAVAAAAADAGALAAGSVVAVDGFVFPVGDPHSFVDTFGAPRMPGTALAHAHQGTDIFAPSGTPLYAVERGIVTRMGTDRLGGIKLWIVGASGTRYYYAHLSAYAPGVHDGLVVEPGHVVGFVGNTGNARTTPSHLHFEVHPGGGAAANPYPLLKAVDDATRAARAARADAAPTP